MVPLPSMDVNHGSSPSTTLLNNHYFEEPRQPNSHSQLITSHSTSSRKSNTLRLPHCIIILFPLYFKNSPLYWLFLLIKRLKQFPVLDWWGAGGGCCSSPEDHSLPWLSWHFLKENSRMLTASIWAHTLISRPTTNTPTAIHSFSQNYSSAILHPGPPHSFHLLFLCLSSQPLWPPPSGTCLDLVFYKIF